MQSVYLSVTFVWCVVDVTREPSGIGSELDLVYFDFSCPLFPSNHAAESNKMPLSTTWLLTVGSKSGPLDFMSWYRLTDDQVTTGQDWSGLVLKCFAAQTFHFSSKPSNQLKQRAKMKMFDMVAAMAAQHSHMIALGTPNQWHLMERRQKWSCSLPLIYFHFLQHMTAFIVFSFSVHF